MRTTFVDMCEFNDNAHGQNKVFYMEDIRWKSERGTSGGEGERERGERVKHMRERLLRKKGSAWVIKSTAGRISELFICLGKTYHKFEGSLDTWRTLSALLLFIANSVVSWHSSKLATCSCTTNY
jgi:hypothetical protein